jgi:hypothetical protein
MSTVSTPYGVASARTYDEVYVNTLDMESHRNRFDSGVWTRGDSGYILLTVTNLAWASSAASFGTTDILTIDFDIAGFNPITMTQIADTTGDTITRYRITSPNGSIAFGSGTGNEAKYVWAVKDGEVQGASYNEDGTFSAARLRAYLQETNILTDPVTFTITYTLTFTDLTSTISGLSTASSVSLAIDDSKPLHRKFLNATPLSGSGYGLFKIGQIQTSVEVPPRTSVFDADPDALPPVFTIMQPNNDVMWAQYAARHYRSKTFSTNPFYNIYAVNQGKIDMTGETVDSVYNLAELRLDRKTSQNNANVTMNYGVNFTSV